MLVIYYLFTQSQIMYWIVITHYIPVHRLLKLPTVWQRQVARIHTEKLTVSVTSHQRDGSAPDGVTSPLSAKVWVHTSRGGKWHDIVLDFSLVGVLWVYVWYIDFKERIRSSSPPLPPPHTCCSASGGNWSLKLCEYVTWLIIKSEEG